MLFLLILQAIAINPSHAQIDGSTGGGFKAFEINIDGFSCDGGSCGMVLVIAKDAQPPKGFIAGNDYWAWPENLPWRYAFTLVPSSRTPGFADYHWYVFPNSYFDLSYSYPFPALSLEEEDGFYTFLVGDNPWSQKGWLWLRKRSSLTQIWFGYRLNKPLVGTSGEAIHFIYQSPPHPASVEIFLEK